MVFSSVCHCVSESASSGGVSFVAHSRMSRRCSTRATSRDSLPCENRRRANRFRTNTFTHNTFGGEAFCGPQQFVASLSNQLQTSRDRDVGQHMRGVLDSQSILHQPVAASLTEQRMKDSLMTFHAQSAQASNKQWAQPPVGLRR